MVTIQAIGEQGLLRHLQQFSPPMITGDDAAVINSVHPQQLVVSTDLLIEGIHFGDRTTSGFDSGWRAAAANLSDLAAMGAMPVGITVALGLPGETELDWVLELYRGMTACLTPWQTPILGGDVSRSPVRTVGITVLGSVMPGKAFCRHTAQVGDWIIATGIHGASKAGLESLLNSASDKTVATSLKTAWQRAHQRPVPRLELLPSLHSLQTRITGMDSSDGLADAVLQICRASSKGAELWAKKFPPPLA